ncbi:MAG: ArsA-related P-loop ATPase [Candidatus Binataceae bacterium]
MLGELFARRLLFILGKGGVGKTALCAALARVGASGGTRSIVMECDSRTATNSLFGVTPKFEPADVGLGVSVASLDGGHALEEYLRLVVPGRAVLHAVFASRLYNFFVQAAPGLRELMMMGKVCHELERRMGDAAAMRGEKQRGRPRTEGDGLGVGAENATRRWGLIVVDAPPSGQALGLLRMPFAARRTFGESIVGREAEKIGQTLRDTHTTAIVQVTTPEAFAISETLETFDALVAMKLKPAAVLFNRHVPVEFDERDIASVTDAIEDARARSHVKELACAELARRRASAEALTILCERTRVAIVEIGDYPGTRPAELVDRLAADLASRVEADRARRATRRAR